MVLHDGFAIWSEAPAFHCMHGQEYDLIFCGLNSNVFSNIYFRVHFLHSMSFGDIEQANAVVIGEKCCRRSNGITSTGI